MFEMFDIQSGGISLVLIALLESIAIGWVYGKKIAYAPLIKSMPECVTSCRY